MKSLEIYLSKVSGCERIFLNSHNSLVTIDVEEILFCKADGNYSKLFIGNGESYLMSKSLCEFEKSLNKHNFLRTHNSFLVNLKKVKSYCRNGRFVIVAGFNIPISRRKCKDIILILLDFDIKEAKRDNRIINI